MNKSESDIIKSWQQNGVQWINTIETNQIKSRAEATNQAIIDAIMELKPKTLLDMGCGEGWLCRHLSKYNINCTGIDGVPELVNYATSHGGGQFILASYKDLLQQKIGLSMQSDLIAFNFSLFGKENTIDILRCIKANVANDGRILIQTIHPENNAVVKKQSSHWLTENWQGFEADFIPFTWYFRTQVDWELAFQEAGLKLLSTTSVLLKPNANPFAVIYKLGIKV